MPYEEVYSDSNHYHYPTPERAAEANRLNAEKHAAWDNAEAVCASYYAGRVSPEEVRKAQAELVAAYQSWHDFIFGAI